LQAVLRPGGQGAMHERGVDEEVDAVDETRLDNEYARLERRLTEGGFGPSRPIKRLYLDVTRLRLQDSELFGESG
jgi:hypothetical protein